MGRKWAPETAVHRIELGHKESPALAVGARRDKRNLRMFLIIKKVWKMAVGRTDPHLEKGRIARRT